MPNASPALRVAAECAAVLGLLRDLSHRYPPAGRTSPAVRAAAAFPDARLHWFERSGHLPVWDEPAETARLVLERTAA